MIDQSIVEAAKKGTPRKVKTLKVEPNVSSRKDKELTEGDFSIPPELSKLKDRTTESLLQEYSDIIQQQSIN